LPLTDAPPMFAGEFTGFDAPPKYENIAVAALSPEIVPETEISSAFVRLWNTLAQHSQSILKPLIAGLTEVQTKLAVGDVRLTDLNREIAELNERNAVLGQLLSKEYIDSALFIEQTQQNDAKLADLKRRRGHLLDLDDDNAIGDLQNLADITDGAELLESFNELCFESVVAQITIESRERIRFRLLGGVEFAEPITVKERIRK
jgi:hypothetical protein